MAAAVRAVDPNHQLPTPKLLGSWGVVHASRFWRARFVFTFGSSFRFSSQAPNPDEPEHERRSENQEV
jgi:hypothetical protein